MRASAPAEYLVAEADESDASFMHLQPMIAIVTNVDADHLGTHGGDFGKLKLSFVEFLHNLPFYGLAIICSDDAEAAALVPQIARPYLTYGFGESADVRAVERRAPRHAVAASTCCARARRRSPVTLNLPGRHNVLNSLAAIASRRSSRSTTPRSSARWRASRASTGACSGSATWTGAFGARHAGRRLRPPPDRDGRDARGRAAGLAGAAHRARVPAAPLHAHARPARRFRPGALHGRCARRRRGLCGRRGADRRRRRQGAVPRDSHARPRRAGAAQVARRTAAGARRHRARRRRRAHDGRRQHRRRCARRCRPRSPASPPGRAGHDARASIASPTRGNSAASPC